MVWFNYRDGLGNYQLQDDSAGLAAYRRIAASGLPRQAGPGSAIAGTGQRG